MKKVVEMVKTIALTALVAGIVGYMVGTHMEQANSHRLEQAVKAIAPPAQAQVNPK